MMQAFSALTILGLCLSAQSVPPDYKAYFAAGNAAANGRHAEVIPALEPVWSLKPPSPLAGHAALQAARSYIQLGKPKSGLEILQRFSDQLPRPAGELVLAKCADAAGEKAIAAGAYQRVYYEYPASEEAVEAEKALGRLAAAMGDDYPPAMPQAVFQRAELLRKAKQQVRAKRELLAAAQRFKGLDRELATVRANWGDYRGLSLVRVTRPEADAERLYLMHAASRKGSAEAKAEAALRELEKKYPDSRWTMEALISWGNHHYLRNDVEEYRALYRKCVDRFPSDPQAAYCHWRLAWSGWMRREPQARKLLDEHLTRFPDSDKAAAALYFLGRYQAVIDQFPLSFYSTLARAKVKVAAKKSVDPAQFSASALTRLRIERARQLDRANFDDWAVFELKYAASEQPYIAAMELADMARRRGAHDQALRYIKSVAKGYLTMPLESAPERFWQLAFPLPYRDSLLIYTRDRELDPNMVAALIRQESEFNPKAVSRARAVGLTQVLPSTGRQLSRRVGMRAFRPSMLYQPEVNLNLGTYYLKSLLQHNAGRWEAALASYNAGQSRVNLWSKWHEYREPAEFIESIPFTETRNYVQIVLRNADVYRRLYGEDWSTVRASR